MLDHGRADRDAIDQERAGVVEQAFAFEDLQDPVRQVDLAEDGGRRRRVGRRDDGAERDRGGPGHVRQQPVRRTTATAAVVTLTATHTSVETGSQLSRRSRSEVS